jgi:hypothetical protein
MFAVNEHRDHKIMQINKEHLKVNVYFFRMHRLPLVCLFSVMLLEMFNVTILTKNSENNAFQKESPPKCRIEAHLDVYFTMHWCLRRYSLSLDRSHVVADAFELNSWQTRINCCNCRKSILG